MRQMMLGETLHVTYYTILGERAEASLTLRRANQAIVQFLHAKPLDPEAADEEPTQTFALLAKRFQEFCAVMRLTGNVTDYTDCRETGRAHVRHPVTNAHFVYRLLLEIKTTH